MSDKPLEAAAETLDVALRAVRERPSRAATGDKSPQTRSNAGTVPRGVDRELGIAEGLVELRSNDAVVEVAPGAGGVITRYARLRGLESLDLFRPALPHAVERRVPTDTSCFPLVPFSNRIRDGRFTFDGREIRLPPNFPPEPHAIHGHGWQTSWAVSERADDRLTIGFRHDPDAWPFPYSARQSLSLSGDELTVALAVTNEGDEAMPVGFGLHPYFVRTPRTRISAAVDGVWLSDAGSMPTELVELPADRRLDRGIDPDDVSLDNNFTGWDGVAEIEWADRGLRITMTAEGPFEFLVVYTPPGERFACVEPATNVIDAFNQARTRTDTGTIVLEPGTEVAGAVTFSPEDLA
ncbi:MAG TPA: aldose 1-epimerase [Actinomycetota bacterium]|nr:aldose 1-epimerase [Actinomycetota bacterium]